jgi:hypothetical protein
MGLEAIEHKIGYPGDLNGRDRKIAIEPDEAPVAIEFDQSKAFLAFGFVARLCPFHLIANFHAYSLV